MDDYCDLRGTAGDNGIRCDGDRCPFWRVVEHVGETGGAGCAVKHFELLGDQRTAEWLLSVRERLQRVAQQGEAAGPDGC